ncbi:MAG: 3D domain-containing protein [Actinomycetota bacterium]
MAVDSEVGRYNTEINANSQALAELQASIAAEQRRLEETRRQLSDRQGFLEKRLRGTYKSDDAGYLEVVMGAGDFSELINRLDMINIIAEDDRQLIDSFKDSKTKVEENLASLSANQQELAGLLESLDSSRQNLVAAQARQQSAVASVQSEKEMTENQISQLQAEAASIESSMSQIQSQSYSAGGYSAPPAGGSSFSMTATAYCLGGRTASGMPVGRGVIAVDPGVIPLGSRVHVSGYGDAIAADTGGAIRGNKIDVWLPCGEAYAWGVRSVTVTVY